MEPIKWRIIEEKDGTALLLAEHIIDVQDFSGGWDNIYAYSYIREWLNDYFYGRAFNQEERSLILTTTVDNSAKSSGYSDNINLSDDTQDKVFLLSYEQAFERYCLTDDDRSKDTTPFAWFISAYECENMWWLRSPDKYGYPDNRYARTVSANGNASLMCVHYDTECESCPYTGVVPAIRIRLKEKT